MTMRISSVRRTPTIKIGCLLAAILILTDCTLPHHCDDKTALTPSQFGTLLDQRFECLSVSEGSFRQVYRVRKSRETISKPVIVLHEYPYLSSQCLEFACRLSDRGFCVYLPLLFGEANGKTDKVTRVRNTIALTVSADWHIFSEHEHQPIVDRLRLLCRRVSADHGGKSIGVIGMCLTGSLPIALMDESCVAAPVVAQPTLPIIQLTAKSRERLGISDEELTRAINRINKDPKMELLGFRYELDNVSSRQRFKTLEKAFHSRFQPNIVTQYDKPGAWHLNKRSHATLTHNWASGTTGASSGCLVPGLPVVPRDYPPSQMFEALVTFLNAKL